MKKYFVTIFTEKDGRVFEHSFEPEDSMVNATRIILTFKPKRKHEIVGIQIDVGRTLV